jgi:hypothetical protein
MNEKKFQQSIIIGEKIANSELNQPCGGKNCDGKGKFFLKIKYVNLHGWFCESCVEELKINDFIESEPSNFEDQINCSVPVEKFRRLSQQVPSNSIGED